VLRHAGPWPVEERWWDPLRRRRLARVQVLVREVRTNTERVLLLGLENREWSLLARYD
jgi:protein ImuB